MVTVQSQLLNLSSVKMTTVNRLRQKFLNVRNALMTAAPGIALMSYLLYPKSLPPRQVMIAAMSAQNRLKKHPNAEMIVLNQLIFHRLTPQASVMTIAPLQLKSRQNARMTALHQQIQVSPRLKKAENATTIAHLLQKSLQNAQKKTAGRYQLENQRSVPIAETSRLKNHLVKMEPANQKSTQRQLNASTTANLLSQNPARTKTPAQHLSRL